MDKFTEARRAVLRNFVAAHGGHSAVVQKFNLSPSHASYLSQLVTKDSTASFGEQSARNWEKRLRMRGNPLVYPSLDEPPQVAFEAEDVTGNADLTETLNKLAEFLRAVPEVQRETIAAVLSGLARTPELPSVTSALATLLEQHVRKSKPRKKSVTAETEISK